MGLPPGDIGDAGRQRVSLGRGPFVALLLALSAIAVGLLLSQLHSPYQIDDSFIYYRYAYNALSGHGLRFHEHAAVCEGFTSPLWLALLTGLAKLLGVARLPSIAAALGMLSTVGVAIVLARSDAARGWGSSWRSCVLWCLAPTAVLYANTGLEEPLFLLVIALGHGVGPGANARVRHGALFVAAWVRPEAPWLALTLSAQRLFVEGPRALRERAHLTDLGVLLAGGVSMIATRLVIFRSLLPNTAFAKEPSLLEGASYVLEGLTTPWGIALVVTALGSAWLGTKRERSYLLAAALWALAAMLEGGDWMPSSRLLAPALIFLALAAGGAMPELRRHRLALGAVAIVGGVLGTHASIEQAASLVKTERTLVYENEMLGEKLLELSVTDVALVDIGRLGFALRDTEIFDLAGLTIPEIAHAPGGHVEKRFDRDLLFVERRPDAIVLRLEEHPERNAEGIPVATPDPLRAEVERYIFEDPRFEQSYVPWMSFVPDEERSPYYARVLYLRRDFAARHTPPTERERSIAPRD